MIFNDFCSKNTFEGCLGDQVVACSCSKRSHTLAWLK